MPPERPSSSKQNAVRKRVSYACERCRQQKIRCSGLMPCEQCTKRSLLCNFAEKPQKVLVSREYLIALQRQANANTRTDETNHLRIPHFDSDAEDSASASGTSSYFPFEQRLLTLVVVHGPETANDLSDIDPASRLLSGRQTSRSGSESARASPIAQLTNPFSSHLPSYVADTSGRPWYLGTSSNWAFNRRVLNLAHEKLTGQPRPSQNTPFDGTVYDLGWSGLRDELEPDITLLPSADYATYLINAVRFHCGQIFHLFDEVSFMRQFHQFYNSPFSSSKARSLWYVHFLLVLAFGKAFVARGNISRRPAGASLFVQAMKLMPDVTFLCTQPVLAAEVLSCAALYLHCLDHRCPAYGLIGQAQRIALEQGMHTNMQDESLDREHVQRCRNVWWTIYILDRQMSSFMGLPPSVLDQEITASLPTCSGSLQHTLGLELNVKLSRITSQILNTVYGVDGRLSKKFLTSTKIALKEIAEVTDQLKQSFTLPTSSSMAGVSRISAYLHLMHHQCVVLATRPLLFSFISMRLDQPDTVSTMISSGSARTLILMCVESSQKILTLLDGLKDHGLLETFLPFDLEATFAASIVLLLAPNVDPSLLSNSLPWLETGYRVLDNMLSHGNLQAQARKLELGQLQQVFGTMATSEAPQQYPVADLGMQSASLQQRYLSVMHPDPVQGSSVADTDSSGIVQGFFDESLLQSDLTAHQLLMLADTLDLDGLEWMTTGSSTMAD